MLRRICLTVLLLVPHLVSAQQPPAPTPSSPADFDEIYSARREIFNEKTQHHIGSVELKSRDTTIYADDAWYYPDEDRFVATGNVTFTQGANRISAEQAEFNTKTRLGTFTNASGIALINPPRQAPSATGVVVPQVPGQELMVYFFGDQVEKIGMRKYRITNGGFTTCVQPTPRWDLHSDTVILNLEHYTFLKNAVLTAKGVPMLYLPVLWYPTKSGDRATGFLIPTYGSSTLLGQSLHNAFFWAINRSQDATISHDWYSKVGNGIGGEYRYNYGRLADGNLWMHFLDQHEQSYLDANGNPQPINASKDFEVRGTANQSLPGNIRMRATANYFSSIQSAQTYNTNIYDASRNQRVYGINAVGAWSSWTMNATYDRSEYFYDLTDSNVTGDGPRINFNRNERPLFGSQVYFALATEYANLIRDTRTFDATTTDLQTEKNLGTGRVDVWPQIRYPFKKWQWFTVNTTASFRDTYYTRSAIVIDPETGAQSPDGTSPESINRKYFAVQSQIVGPVFNRIWDTPANGYAEKFKHSIEPYLTVSETTNIDNFNEILHTDGVDTIAGGTNLTYGVVNRFFAKRKLAPGQPAVSREIVDVELSQSYYTNQLQAQYDINYQTSQFGGGTASHFSPYALSVRAMPTNTINATARAEWDPRYHALKTLSANGSYALTSVLQAQAGWSKYGCVAQTLPAGQTCEGLESQNLNTSLNVHTRDNHWGSLYSMNFDVTHTALTQQQVTGFYNAQCCGIAFQYQTYNYGAFSTIPVPSDHRFFLSFTLAGLGAFSPFNGALSGVPR